MKLASGFFELPSCLPRETYRCAGRGAEDFQHRTTLSLIFSPSSLLLILTSCVYFFILLTNSRKAKKVWKMKLTFYPRSFRGVEQFVQSSWLHRRWKDCDYAKRSDNLSYLSYKTSNKTCNRRSNCMKKKNINEENRCCRAAMYRSIDAEPIAGQCSQQLRLTSLAANIQRVEKKLSASLLQILILNFRFSE